MTDSSNQPSVTVDVSLVAHTLKMRKRWTTEAISKVTYITYDMAMKTFLLLFHIDLADIYIRAYHGKHVIKDSFTFLHAPYACEICGQTIENGDDILYDFVCEVKEDVDVKRLESLLTAFFLEIQSKSQSNDNDNEGGVQ